MFDSLFKKSSTTETTLLSEQKQVKPEEQPGRDKEQALQQANALSTEETAGAEAAAVEFILQCQFADARLVAAQHVHSRAMLERVLPAMRNADRRVAKLVQGKLDAMVAEQQGREQAQLCVDQAQRLHVEAHLMPNQVVDLDHAWKLVKAPAEELQIAFDTVRALLRERLEAQAHLQHEVLSRTALLRDFAERASAVDAQELQTTLDQVEQEVAQLFAHTEAVALPKHLLGDFSTLHRQCKELLDTLVTMREALETREALLVEWEQDTAGKKPDQLKALWNAGPPLPQFAHGAALQLRFEALLQGLAEVRDAAHKAHSKASKEEAKAAREATAAARSALGETLDAIEKALQEGHVREALELDKQIRAQEAKKLRISADDAAHLARLRGELKNLQGWAKWGGNVSREELLKAAEETPAQKLPVKELAKKVGGLREHWKALDVSAGPANKDLWERFDAACTTAYAPAAEHFKKLADERKGNQQAALALLAQVTEFAASHDLQAADCDWKAVAAFRTRTTQSWQRLGVIERKEKKRLDQEFEQAMQALLAPLAAQQDQEAAHRKALIAEVQALVPSDRATLDKIKVLQERWQQRAKALPLERKQEQALWQQFRGACDDLFSKRKEMAAGADAERKQHLLEKEALCAALEAASGEPVAVISKLLRDTKDRWSKIGPVPRAQEQRIDARLHAANTALHKRLDDSKRQAALAEQGALQNKLDLCLALEQGLAEGAETVSATLEQWQALPTLSGEVERTLRKRFDSSLLALQNKDQRYLAELEKNRHVLLQNLLRFEIVAGIESPAELSRERLKMQVAVLQSTLKMGAANNKQDGLIELCKLPALADAAAVKRLHGLLGKLKS